MTDRELDLYNASLLRPEDVRQYLSTHGWSLHHTREDSGISVWRLQSASEVLVSPNIFFSDYNEAILRLCAEVAATEKRDGRCVLNDLLTIRRFRMKKEYPQRLPDHKDLVTQELHRVYVDMGGGYHGLRETAIYRSSTHARCEACEKPTMRPYVKCHACREKLDLEKYAAMPREKWDGTGMVYSDSEDKYFSSWDEVNDHVDDILSTDCEYGDGEMTRKDVVEGLRLQMCSSLSPRYIDTEYWSDQLPNDGDDEMPTWLNEAVDLFNKTVAEHADEPLSYTPKNVAVDISEAIKE